jgi:hypothetical protein
MRIAEHPGRQNRCGPGSRVRRMTNIRRQYWRPRCRSSAGTSRQWLSVHCLCSSAPCEWRTAPQAQRPDQIYVGAPTTVADLVGVHFTPIGLPAESVEQCGTAAMMAAVALTGIVKPLSHLAVLASTHLRVPPHGGRLAGQRVGRSDRTPSQSGSRLGSSVARPFN